MARQNPLQEFETEQRREFWINATLTGFAVFAGLLILFLLVQFIKWAWFL